MKDMGTHSCTFPALLPWLSRGFVHCMQEQLIWITPLYTLVGFAACVEGGHAYWKSPLGARGRGSGHSCPYAWTSSIITQVQFGGEILIHSIQSQSRKPDCSGNPCSCIYLCHQCGMAGTNKEKPPMCRLPSAPECKPFAQTLKYPNWQEMPTLSIYS